MKIAIIGAGITGLSAAHTLSKKNHQLVVFERGDVVGGLGTYRKVRGSYIESYYHHFFESDKYIIDLERELKVDSKLKFYTAKTGIFKNKKVFPFNSPITLLKFSPLSMVDRLRCGIVFGVLKYIPFPIAMLDVVSAESFIKSLAGEKVHSAIWGPLLNGKFSEYAKSIPSLWLWGRVRDRSFKLGYFEGSTKTLFDALIKKLRSKKVIIKINSQVESVSAVDEKIIIVADGKKYEFDKVIFTTVSPVTRKLITNELKKEEEKTLTKIDHLGAVCVILELSHQVQSQYWLNICEPKAKVLVMVEQTNMISLKKYGGRHIVYLANYIHRNSPRFKMNDGKIVDEYLSVLKDINPEFNKSWISKSYVNRVPRAQTIFKLNSLKTKPPMKLPLENMYMANIDQMYPHDRNLSQGVELGQEVARLLLSEI